MTKNDKKVPQEPNEKINAEMNAAENVAEGMIEKLQKRWRMLIWAVNRAPCRRWGRGIDGRERDGGFLPALFNVGDY